MNSPETESEEKQNLPIRFVSKIVKGFGRGSADLGIPTANLCEKSTRSSVQYESLPTGIYWGFARIVFDGDGNSISNGDEELKEVFLAAVSVGYNPFYNNKKKTVEPHLIASPESPRRHLSKSRETMFSRDLYGLGIRLSIVKYLRPELPFEGMDKLILAIKNDIKNAEQQSNEVNVSEEMLETMQLEKEWIRSSEDLAD